ncbi:MAG: hypothetical protein FWD90_02965 [Defluviitaleaceae bacterium]|nr:hypothetical protein [Defluviitaleaceae bacterium]
MLTEKQDEVIKIIYNRLDQHDIIWAFTGSTSQAIHGMEIIPVDIDIQTDKAGAYEIGSLLEQYEIEPVAFSSTDWIRSYFGTFFIEGITVEVMGDIQIIKDGKWEEVIDLNTLIEYKIYKGLPLPVMNLAYESAAYRIMGRHERADAINRFLLN